jgi:2-dehydropantoate 2-reductase
MQILIVGAGDVGRTYGRHLQRGGASVAFLVKEKYAETARRGWTLRWMRPTGAALADRFAADEILTTMDGVARERWDQVWLAVSSDALDPSWLNPLLLAVGDAPIISLQPGMHDRNALESRISTDRLVRGLIGIVAWESPLPGELDTPDGLAIWLPPLSASLFSGPRPVVDAVVKVLKKGGCPARRTGDVDQVIARASGAMMPLITALEASNWSFQQLAHSDQLEAGLRAAHEALVIVATHRNEARPLWRFLLRGFFVRIALRVARRVAPMDLERYLRHHFTKVGEQTRQMMGSYVAIGRQHDLPTNTLDFLLSSVHES